MVKIIPTRGFNCTITGGFHYKICFGQGEIMSFDHYFCLNIDYLTRIKDIWNLLPLLISNIFGLLFKRIVEKLYF